ncbi:MAG: geranylgeranylglycerol-phosphate geranylgeranyltransferase [Bacteroidota bacterium]
MSAISLFIKILPKLVRWKNLLIIIATQYLSAYFLTGTISVESLLLDIRMLGLSISTVLIAAAGYVINDYYDVKIDYVNRPERVVVGRYLMRRYILFLHAFLNVTGITIGILVSWKIGFIDFFAAGFLWFYSNLLKRLPLLGNLTVALLTGLSVFIVYVHFNVSFFLFAAYAAFAFFISLIREIIKDIEDLEGDKKFDCKTLPIVLGIRKSKLIIYVINVIFLISVAFLLKQEPKFLWVLSGLSILLGWLSFKLYKADKSKDFSRLSNFTKQIMILGLISMIFFK